jgi:hypothetical protein
VKANSAHKLSFTACVSSALGAYKNRRRFCSFFVPRHYCSAQAIPSADAVCFVTQEAKKKFSFQQMHTIISKFEKAQVLSGKNSCRHVDFRFFHSFFIR